MNPRESRRPKLREMLSTSTALTQSPTPLTLSLTGRSNRPPHPSRQRKSPSSQRPPPLGRNLSMRNPPLRPNGSRQPPLHLHHRPHIPHASLHLPLLPSNPTRHVLLPPQNVPLRRRVPLPVRRVPLRDFPLQFPGFDGLHRGLQIGERWKCGAADMFESHAYEWWT